MCANKRFATLVCPSSPSYSHFLLSFSLFHRHTNNKTRKLALDMSALVEAAGWMLCPVRAFHCGTAECNRRRSGTVDIACRCGTELCPRVIRIVTTGLVAQGVCWCKQVLSRMHTDNNKEDNVKREQQRERQQTRR